MDDALAVGDQIDGPGDGDNAAVAAGQVAGRIECRGDVVGGLDAPPTTAVTGQRQYLRGIAPYDARTPAEELPGQRSAVRQRADGHRVEDPRRARVGCRSHGLTGGVPPQAPLG